jgi:hypothetical protein
MGYFYLSICLCAIFDPLLVPEGVGTQDDGQGGLVAAQDRSHLPDAGTGHLPGALPGVDQHRHAAPAAGLAGKCKT